MKEGVPTRVVLASKSPARRATLVAAGITPEVIVSHVDEPAVLAALPGGRAFSGGSTTPADEVLALATAKCRAVAEGLEQGRIGFPSGEASRAAGFSAAAGLSAAAGSSGAAGPSGAAATSVRRLVVVGCDSMLELDARMLGKPHLPDVARERIREMRNRSALLWTGHYAVVLEQKASHGQSVPGGWEPTGQVGASASTAVHFGEMSDAEIDAYVDSGEPLKVAGSFTVDGLGGPFITGIEGDYHSVVGLSLPLLRTMLNEVGVFWPDLWDHRHEEGASSS